MTYIIFVPEMEIAFNNLPFGVSKYHKATVKNCSIEISFTVMTQRSKFVFRFTILKRFHSDPTVIAVISTLLHFHFTNFRENHRNACKMASNELQPGANAQCPPRLMHAHRFELSTEAFNFYGSAEVLRKSYNSTEQRRLTLQKS